MRQETLGLVEKPSELSAHTSELAQLVWLVEAHPFCKQKLLCRVTFALYVPLCNPEDILLQLRAANSNQIMPLTHTDAKDNLEATGAEPGNSRACPTVDISVL